MDCVVSHTVVLSMYMASTNSRTHTMKSNHKHNITPRHPLLPVPRPQAIFLDDSPKQYQPALTIRILSRFHSVTKAIEQDQSRLRRSIKTSISGNLYVVYSIDLDQDFCSCACCS